MKKKISFWILVGLAIVLATGFASGNFAASAFIATGASTLLAILTNMEVDRKIRN